MYDRLRPAFGCFLVSVVAVLRVGSARPHHAGSHGNHLRLAVAKPPVDKSERCHKNLDAAWDSLQRGACTHNMFAKLDEVEESSPDCSGVRWGDSSFDESQTELYARVRTLCGPGAAPRRAPCGHHPNPLALRAEQKLQQIAKEEQQDLEEGERSNVEGVSSNELEASARRVAGGCVEGARGLQAAQNILNSQNLTSTESEAEGGEDAPVITSEDVRQVTAEALDTDPDAIALQENAPGDAGLHHVFAEGDMRLLKKSSPKAIALISAWRENFNSEFRAFSVPGEKVAAGHPFPKGEVPYCFAPDLSKRAQRAFEDSVRHYEKTLEKYGIDGCITFKKVELMGGKCVNGDGLKVQSTEVGTCWADLGYLWNAGNVVNLGTGCETKGIVVHEIGHALGMDHEQSRPDRDTYVKIEWGNIREGLEDQFELNPEAYTKEPYDFLSIMHYGQFTFSKKRGSARTISVAEGAKAKSSRLGQSMGLSEGDAKQLHDMYCPDREFGGAGGAHKGSAAQDSFSAVTGLAVLTSTVLMRFF